MSLPTLQTAGMIMSGIGALKNAMSQKEASNYNATVQMQNAAVATQQGEAAVIQQRRRNDLLLGDMRANYGASGIRTDVGSPLDVLADSASQAELDVQNIRYNAALRSRGFMQGAELDGMRGRNDMSSGLLSAAGQSILGYSRNQNYAAKAGTPIPNYTIDEYSTNW